LWNASGWFDKAIAIEGRFELPQLARLTMEDSFHHRVCPLARVDQGNGTHLWR